MADHCGLAVNKLASRQKFEIQGMSALLRLNRGCELTPQDKTGIAIYGLGMF
jgi:hypothetical protein